MPDLTEGTLRKLVDRVVQCDYNAYLVLDWHSLLETPMKTTAWIVMVISFASCSSKSSGPSGYGGAGGGLGGFGGYLGGATGTGGSATGGSPGFGTPVEVTTVLLPQINPAWPLGEWDGSLNAPQVVIDCGTSQQAYTQVYDISVTAGSGLDFTSTTIMESGAAIGGWKGTLSADNQSVLVPASTINYTDSRGAPATTVDAPLTFKLTYASSTQLGARLYAGSTVTSGGQTCKFQIKDYTLKNTDKRISDVLQGTSTATLDAPVALTRWGSFAVDGFGLGQDEASFRHSVTPVVDGGSMPDGIVLDDKGWAVKVATNALWFYVMVKFTNSSSTAACLYESDISSVENSANIPVHESLSTSYAAPAYIVLSTKIACLRPGDSGWIIGSVSVASGDSAAFTNAAIVKIKPPSHASPFSDSVEPTPYKVRYTAGGGLHVDVIDPAYSIRVVYLDDKGLPVGSDSAYDYIPSTHSSLKHLVYTYSFPEPDVLGTAKTVLAYAATSAL
jgi:hypothetical protein